MIDQNLHTICKNLATLTSGSKLSMMFTELGLPCGSKSSDGKWKRIYDAIITDQDSTHPNATLIKIIEWIMAPSQYLDKQEDYIEEKDKLNKSLSFIGLEVLPNGKVHSRSVVTTLEEANQTVSRLKRDLQKFNIHPQILKLCRPEIISENLFHLIFEASKCLMEKLRTLSESSLDGNQLVNQCFSGKEPLIMMNKLQTADERSEHWGLQALLNAIVYLYRNPKAHQLKYFSNDNYQSTLEALIMISQARYALDRCSRNDAL